MKRRFFRTPPLLAPLLVPMHGTRLSHSITTLTLPPPYATVSRPLTPLPQEYKTGVETADKILEKFPNHGEVSAK